MHRDGLGYLSVTRGGVVLEIAPTEDDGYEYLKLTLHQIGLDDTEHCTDLSMIKYPFHFLCAIDGVVSGAQEYTFRCEDKYSEELFWGKITKTEDLFVIEYNISHLQNPHKQPGHGQIRLTYAELAKVKALIHDFLSM